MGNDFIFLLVIAAAGMIYFVFFNNNKKAYPEDKIKDTFDTVDSILSPHENDHSLVIRIKEQINDELRVVRREYSRTPSMYTREEIDAFEKIIPELKQQLKDFCKNLIDLKASCVNVIESEKKMLQSAKNAMKATEENGDESEDSENVMDIFEKILESSPIKIKEHEEDLRRLEKSISRYQSL
jgi:hypothetical protein